MPALNLREAILKEHSKTQCTAIVNWVAASQQKFDELFRFFLSNEPLIAQRAAWPVSYCVIAHPELIKKHWAALLKNLQKPNLHNAIKRNSIRLMEEIEIPKKYQGQVMDICFKYLESPVEAIAVKAFSLTVLSNLAKQYPEIVPEMKLIIEDQQPHFTAALKVRAKCFYRLMKQL